LEKTVGGEGGIAVDEGVLTVAAKEKENESNI